ncbi:MAG: 1-deoxy-D-xylulose-5-phosphate reductoisomerase [Clostridia bacterium]|nr:1-deoxy-D-xylulose-5-phosphate reductoisomerase [Clostridia bacterium]
MKQIGILGSTGSIGTQTLQVAEHLGIRVVSLTAHRNIHLLEEQIRKFSPKVVSVTKEADAKALREAISDLDTEVYFGDEGLIAAATADGVETLVTAVMGSVGLFPTLAAIEKGIDIALANKETLVCAGDIVMSAAEKHGVKILPVDSEHSAIFQSLAAGNRADLQKILLTCSGGAFRGKTRDELLNVRAADALKHPNWSMGQKITIDSATLMNKGLELIEAMHLFSVTPEQIQVLIHPQSIIHSMVEFRDGSVIAQLGTTDMRIPIQYALTYPNRVEGLSASLDFFTKNTLTFSEPDLEAFPCLALATHAAKVGGTLPTVMNAANEVAVAAFLEDRISFMEIAGSIQSAMDAHKVTKAPTLEEIAAVDRETRVRVSERISRS